MNRVFSSAWGLALCIAAIPFAFAQAAYLNGGGGDEERAAMAARQHEFPFKVVMSGARGEYVVADSLNVSTAQGEVLAIRDAGPIVMLKLPPGDYTLEASWKGKTERRSVRLATSAQTLEWRFPG